MGWFSVSDTLELYHIDSNRTLITLVKKGIAWWTDKHVKFRNPGGNGNLTAVFQGDMCKHHQYLLDL